MKIGYYESGDTFDGPFDGRVQSEWEVTFSETGECQIKWIRTFTDPDSGEQESKIIIFKGRLSEQEK